MAYGERVNPHEVPIESDTVEPDYVNNPLQMWQTRDWRRANPVFSRAIRATDETKVDVVVIASLQQPPYPKS